jgi:hypothetical protein
MDQDLLDLCEAAFTDQVETLFRKLKRRGKLVFAAPLIGGIYAAGDAAAVKRLVYKALIARKSFEINRPPGSLPPPWPLPLHYDAIDKMFASPYSSSRLEAFYANSWKQTNWDLRHPLYGQFRDRLLCGRRIVRQTLPRSGAKLRLRGFQDLMTRLCAGSHPAGSRPK